MSQPIGSVKTAGKRHGPMKGMQAPAEKPRDFKGSMKKLLRYLREYRVGLILVLFFSAASTIFAIIGPKLLGNVTTELFNGVMRKLAGTGGVAFDVIAQRLLFLLSLYAISLIFSYTQSWIMTGITQKLTYRLRNDITQKINRLPLRYFDKVNHGEVLSRITNDVDTLGQSLNQSLTQAVSSVTTLVGILIMMLSISWQLTLIALCSIPLSAVIIAVTVAHSQKYFVQQQEYLGHVNGQVEEIYGGHLVMKAFCGEDRAVRQFDTYNNTLYNSAWKSQFFSGLMMPLMNFVSNLGYVAVTIAGGWFAVHGSLNIGDIQAFIQYVRQFNQPITQIANIGNILQQTAATSERIFEFLWQEEEMPERSLEQTEKQEFSKTTTFAGSVQFEHVQFSYVPETIILKDFTASIEPGQKIAIVGPTGAGKTTLVKLLMRFYDVTGGKICVDGQDIRNFARHNLRTLFGMVLQDTWLFHGSILENIRYGRLDASDDEVLEAAKAAQADHFIRTLPGGYQFVLNEEASNVSQGQKQLLTIARAILSNPKILILDEATSSVDTRTEILIQKAMDVLMRNRTSFVIAHRLSTIKNADRILYMENGDIVEQGTHEELLAKNGRYAQLYKSQFENSA